MSKHSFRIFSLFFALLFFANYTTSAQQTEKVKDSIKTDVTAIDSVKTYENCTFKLYKKKAHASYYHNKFNGKRTTSGIRFNNNKYTAAHRKFPFGTKLKVTNEANGKFVIVEVIDRGPFTRGREIDLTRRAFMEIVANKNSGFVLVTIEEVKEIQ
ncbi:MAG: septal ring lytic transglycosylase RlpA family protein [Bacteroidota bacterium]